MGFGFQAGQYSQDIISVAIENNSGRTQQINIQWLLELMQDKMFRVNLQLP